MDRREELSRRFVLRAYGVVSFLQTLLGLCLIATGILALLFFEEEEFNITRPPYFTGAFLVGLLIIMAAVSTMYIYFTRAPVIDYYFLENSAVMRIRRAVTANTCISLVTILCCILGLFICIVFAIGPCDSYEQWLGPCSFQTHKLANRFLALFVTMFLAAAFLVLIYSSLMGCIHGWVFDFDVVNIRVNDRKHVERPVSLYKQAECFDVEEEPAVGEDEALVVNKYNETSSFKQSGHKSRFADEPDPSVEHDQCRKHHIPAQQTPNYVAVLNDPAMKQKLQERNSKLQET